MDIISQNSRFGQLLAIRQLDERDKHGKIRWECLCDCGSIVQVNASSLRRGLSQSCGCSQIKYRNGQVFGELEIIGFDQKKRNIRKAIVRCSCGEIKYVEVTALRSRKTPHCGCKSSSVTKLPEYSIWSGMKDRCYNDKNPKFLYYGARGIKVCDSWKNSFINFYKDIGPRPKGLSLERKDVNGDYCPDNCCWASSSHQKHNRRTIKSRVSAYRGVFPYNKKWEAKISKDHCSYVLGYFDTEEIAAQAYNIAAKILYGDSAYINLLDSQGKEDLFALVKEKLRKSK